MIKIKVNREFNLSSLKISSLKKFRASLENVLKEVELDLQAKDFEGNSEIQKQKVVNLKELKKTFRILKGYLDSYEWKRF